MFVRITATFTILFFTGCASFPYRVPLRDKNIKDVIAGSTLECAADTQRKGVLLGLAGGGLIALSGTVGGLTAASIAQAATATQSSTSEGEAALPIVATVGLGALGAGASIAGIVMQLTATQYMEQAGKVFIGTEAYGGCESHPIPKRLLIPKKKRTRTRKKTKANVRKRTSPPVIEIPAEKTPATEPESTAPQQSTQSQAPQ